ncbi:transmembrane channel-like protein 5 isoform X2 [Condylostylus longicornis]|uniref:transmembrane channel-like protein 5 isoform X2 n=1 Tax=Condylostylus longicornis TaxID=2530218 RepID=UPI00244DB505|nr:transmembrane channel-like protein 5 isoform X2 [Condylostylus longicornis]
MQGNGALVNNSFIIEDYDRIEIEPVSTSHSDLNSTGSQQFLTDSQTNFRFFQQTKDGNDRIPTPSNMVRRWSQNLSKIGKGRKTIKEKTIYSLPSRKDNQLLGTPNEIEIDRLANEIEQNESLMEDSPQGKQMRMETIRALPHSLTAKRRLKEKLAVSVTQNASKVSIGFFRKYTSRTKYLLVKFYNRLRGFLSSIELWYDSMKEIEGHFGSGVGTYFKFLRWLFMLDLFLLVFTFSFISFPEILYDIYENNTEIQSKDLFEIEDLFTAEGYIKSSILFYGAYTNTTFSIPGTSYTYSLPHAYYMTNLCLYLFTFIIISSSMARSYRRSFIETSGGIKPMYAHKIFCSWDFSISNLKAAKLKKSSIFTELKETLSELEQPKIEYSKMWRLWIFCSQLTAHLLVCGMIAGLGVAMWILLQNFAKDDESTAWETLYLAIAVNITMLVLQSFFAWISKMEDYETPRRTLHITLMRNFLLEAVIIGVLIYFWLTKDYKGCWETSVGQEIYRLIIVDFIISGLGLPFVQLLQVLLFKKFWPSMSKPSFDISRKSLGLVFNQTLLWVGLLFSPMLSAVVTLKMISNFYIMKYTLIHLSKSPKHMWKSAQTQTLYLVFTFLSLLGVIVSLGYIMTQVKISEKCGPFREHQFMFQIFIDGVLQLKQNSWVWRAIMTVTRPAVLGGILLTMAVVAYYLRAKSKARGTMVKLLKDMLYLEAKDKEFLLMNIARITHNREWLFIDEDIQNDIPENNFQDYAESSSTWRYRKNNMPNRSETILRSRFI